MQPKKEIIFAIETVEDLRWNGNYDKFFTYLEELIKQGYKIVFYRINKSNNALTNISDTKHLMNFKNNFDFPRN